MIKHIIAGTELKLIYQEILC